MNISNKQYYTIFFAIISIILFICIFKWIDYLSNNSIIKECFRGYSQNYSPSNSNIDLPLTTTYSCKNWCGPQSRCSITGQQCSADIDCPGCQPYSPPLKKAPCDIPPDDDAGKLTWGVTPQYSILTNGYGTHERVITEDVYAKPSMANFGPNTYIDSFNEEDTLFNKRYQPSGLQYMPNYAQKYTLTGEFIEDGPLPSNATLPKDDK